jgi:hypothetical protein
MMNFNCVQYTIAYPLPHFLVNKIQISQRMEIITQFLQRRRCPRGREFLAPSYIPRIIRRFPSLSLQVKM